jgi:hypothetical protein
LNIVSLASAVRTTVRVTGGRFGGVVDYRVVEARDGVITGQDGADRGDADEMAETADRSTCALMQILGVAGRRPVAVFVEAQSPLERCD